MRREYADRIVQTSRTELGQCDTQGSKYKGRKTSRVYCSRRWRIYLRFVFALQRVQNSKVACDGVRRIHGSSRLALWKGRSIQVPLTLSCAHLHLFDFCIFLHRYNNIDSWRKTMSPLSPRFSLLLHKDLNFRKGFYCNLISSSYQCTGPHGSRNAC